MTAPLIFTATFALAFALGMALADRLWLKRHAKETRRLTRLAHQWADEYGRTRELLAMHEAAQVKRCADLSEWGRKGADKTNGKRAAK